MLWWILNDRQSTKKASVENIKIQSREFPNTNVGPMMGLAKTVKLQSKESLHFFYFFFFLRGRWLGFNVENYGELANLNIKRRKWYHTRTFILVFDLCNGAILCVIFEKSEKCL